MHYIKGFAALVVAAGLAAGCNVSTQGAEGNILFTPDECGRVATGCDFEDSIGVGGSIDVHIQGIGEQDVATVDLVTDDPDVLTAEFLGVVSGLPTWELVGTGPGVARLIAIDGEVEVDFIEVGVQDVAGLTLAPFAGTAEGPTSDEAYDEIWRVSAGQDVSFFLTPLIGDGVPTMGVFTYEVSTTTPEILGFLDESADIDTGNVRMTPQAGDYELVFESAFTPPLAVLFQVQ